MRPDCPGYTVGGRVMVCYPPTDCGNATYFWCESNDHCDWWYREPHGERSDVGRMGVRPDWLDTWAAEIDALGEGEES